MKGAVRGPWFLLQTVHSLLDLHCSVHFNKYTRPECTKSHAPTLSSIRIDACCHCSEAGRQCISKHHYSPGSHAGVSHDHNPV